MTQPRYITAPPATAGRYTLGVEHIWDVRSEIYPLHCAHWAETEELYLTDPGDACRPDYARAARCQDDGQYVLFTGRETESGELVANLAFFVMVSFHDSKRLSANEDVFFVSKPHRGRLAFRLLAYAESVLAEIGVKSIGITDKAPCGGPDLAKFLARRDYTMVARYFRKPLR